MLTFVVSLLPLLAAAADTTSGSATEGEELATLINDYREDEGLSRAPFSKTMMKVGSEHVINSIYARDNNLEHYADGSCNMHSWDAYPGKTYSTCCYTSDHAAAACMWNKPKEISTSDLDEYYGSSGYEISASGYSSLAAALNGWKGSSGHNDVILNNGMWASYTWLSLGCGADLSERYYHCWFGSLADPNPYQSSETTTAPLTTTAPITTKTPATTKIATTKIATTLYLVNYVLSSISLQFDNTTIDDSQTAEVCTTANEIMNNLVQNITVESFVLKLDDCGFERLEQLKVEYSMNSTLVTDSDSDAATVDAYFNSNEFITDLRKALEKKLDFGNKLSEIESEAVMFSGTPVPSESPDDGGSNSGSSQTTLFIILGAIGGSLLFLAVIFLVWRWAQRRKIEKMEQRVFQQQMASSQRRPPPRPTGEVPVAGTQYGEGQGQRAAPGRRPPPPRRLPHY